MGRPRRCIKPSLWRAGVLKSPGEARSFAARPPALANLTLREFCRLHGSSADPYVRIVARKRDLGAEENYSAALPILTGRWGDLVGDCSVSPCAELDGVVDFIDVAAIIVDKFRNLAHAPQQARADIAENRLDTRIDFIDISWAVAAFRGWGYPFDGRVPCKSSTVANWQLGIGD